jgi:hypothetical protein
MYIIVWKKYLPAIKILMKKAAGGDQVLGLNKTDFEKDKVARKTNSRFSFHMTNGSLPYNTTLAPIAREFVTVLQEDAGAGGILYQQEFVFSMNSKYELSIHLEPKAPVEEVEVAENAVVAAEA